VIKSRWSGLRVASFDREIDSSELGNFFRNGRNEEGHHHGSMNRRHGIDRKRIFHELRWKKDDDGYEAAAEIDFPGRSIVPIGSCFAMPY